MKTKLLTLATIAVIALNVSGALAATCEGGSLITGANGHEYCQSNNTMNWWSAYTWCEAQGRHLASMYELCPTWDGSTGDGKCANINNSFSLWVWTSTPYQENKAFAVFDSGSVENTETRTYTRYALCY